MKLRQLVKTLEEQGGGKLSVIYSQGKMTLHGPSGGKVRISMSGKADFNAASMARLKRRLFSQTHHPKAQCI